MSWNIEAGSSNDDVVYPLKEKRIGRISLGGLWIRCHASISSKLGRMSSLVNWLCSCSIHVQVSFMLSYISQLVMFTSFWMGPAYTITTTRQLGGGDVH